MEFSTSRLRKKAFRTLLSLDQPATWVTLFHSSEVTLAGRADLQSGH